MFLADTSAWIDFARPRPKTIGLALREHLQSGLLVHIAGVILQEVLQGTRDELHFKRYRDWMRAQPFVQPADPVATHEAAARLYASCRWRGITVRKSTDCFIAQLAIEHHLTLLHDDDDFRKIASVQPRLKLA